MFYATITLLSFVSLVVFGVCNWKRVFDRLVPKYKYSETGLSDYVVGALLYLILSVFVSLLWPLVALILSTLAVTILMETSSNVR